MSSPIETLEQYLATGQYMIAEVATIPAELPFKHEVSYAKLVHLHEQPGEDPTTVWVKLETEEEAEWARERAIAGSTGP